MTMTIEDSVQRLKREIPILIPFDNNVIAGLYAAWSEEVYFVGWMCINEGCIKEFERWMKQK